MSDLYFKIDEKLFQDVMESCRKDLQDELNEGIRHLTDMTFEKTLELASEGLHTTFDVYKDNLSSRKESAGVYIISLDQKALWIEEGLPENFDLKDGLLNSPKAKTSADGHKYMTVPFKHNKGPSKNTPKAQGLVDQIKKVLRQEKISFGMEKNKDGSYKIGSGKNGLLHKIDIDSAKPTAKASTPALQGLRIYQKRDEEGKMVRGIYTFRTVTDGPGSEGKFIHPGLDAKKFMDKALEWAEKTFDKEILPELLKKWGTK